MLKEHHLTLIKNNEPVTEYCRQDCKPAEKP